MMLALFASLLTALFMVPGQTGDFSVFGGLGIGMSSVEKSFYILDSYGGTLVDTDNGSYIPAFGHLLYRVSPKIQLGAEVEVCLGNLSGDYTWYDQGGSGPGEWEISMTAIGGLAKVFLSDDVYVRGGIANYSAELEFVDQWTSGKMDFESGFGINFGAGYIMLLSETVYGGLEGVYHMVSLVPDAGGDSDDIQLDHYALRVMVGTGL